MKLLDLFIVVITWFVLTGIYILLRSLSLKRGYRDSNEKSFLDYFENVYLESKGKTWRRRYSAVYNSRIYWIISYIIMVVSFILAIGLIVFCVVVSNTELGVILNTEVFW